MDATTVFFFLHKHDIVVGKSLKIRTMCEFELIILLMRLSFVVRKVYTV